MSGSDGLADATAPDRPRKRSLTLRGHRTSVSLEDAFWQRFCRLAVERGHSINGLAASIDAARPPEVPLASAMRVYVVEAVDPPPDVPGSQPSVASTGKVSSRK
ncbi:MAG: ribbon-helix-helix domain-containing protein [Pseudomonadota bacterium]